MEEDAGEIDGQDSVPFLQRHFHRALVNDCRGVVDEDVELAETFDGKRYHRLRGLLTGHVADKWDDAILTFENFLHLRVDVFGDDESAASV